ncbi:MAG: sugar nucleotide-binding protein [Myxococcales bacterium]
MIRVLVLGSTGMVGQTVLRVLSREPGLAVDGTHRRGQGDDPLWFDAERGPEGLPALLRRAGAYSHVVNCIGDPDTRVERSDAEKVRRSIALNALFPQQLAAAAKGTGARIIHISTDGVFAGSAEVYDENAAPDSTDVYGRTKSLGELVGESCVTFRCSIVGPDPEGKRGLWEWFRTLPGGARVPGFTNQIWSGMTSLQFAQLCRRIIVEGRFEEIRRESPVHHLCPNRPLSKLDLLGHLKIALGKDVEIVPEEANPLRRILITRYRSVRELSGQDQDVGDAIQELAAESE